ncbi:hypothetical protein [Sporolactobacillus shoreae]|uniref:hypothetical protein n=1 Tax=Sporolactobacillus shoreae TaxID=1465501 RepID=UPI0014329323|nr:hypothetical protein [Sporolactobacillus shoreae]
MIFYQILLILLAIAGAIGSWTERRDWFLESIFILLLVGSLSALLLTFPEVVY